MTATRNIILHIGQHKTGSKALQTCLYTNRDYLRDNGYIYPGYRNKPPLKPYEVNHSRLFETLRFACLQPSPPEEAFGSLVQELALLLGMDDSTKKTTILSSEDLFDLHTAHELDFDSERHARGPALLAKAFDALHCKVRIVCYLRRQDHLLASHYGQIIKGSQDFYITFEDYRDYAAPRLNSDVLIRPWEQAFGAENICIFAYETMELPAGIVPQFFDSVLNLSPPSKTNHFSQDLEAFNITPSRPYLEYLRCLNQRASQRFPVLPRHQVLAAAFRDASDRGRGIAAWLTPAERRALLDAYAPGNHRMAERLGVPSPLFREPEPSLLDSNSIIPSPDLAELVDLDQHVRNVSVARCRREGLVAALRQRLWRRQLLWLVPKSVEAGDLRLATSLCAGLIGHPDVVSQVVSDLHVQSGGYNWIVVVGLAALRLPALQHHRPRWPRRARVVLVSSRTANPLQARMSLGESDFIPDAIIHGGSTPLALAERIDGPLGAVQRWLRRRPIPAVRGSISACWKRLMVWRISA
jgi:hypothetical protein